MNYLRNIYVKIVLFIVSLVLAYMLYDSIVSPIVFNREKANRYFSAIEKLKYLRDAQVMYNTSRGRYCKSYDELENFIDTARIPIKETKDTMIVERQGRLDIRKEIKMEKIIGYEIVKSKFESVDYKNLRYIDNSKEIEFDIQVGFIESNHIKTSVFEISIPKKILLRGLSKSLIFQEETNPSLVRGDKLKVGDMKKATTSGNWAEIEIKD